MKRRNFVLTALGSLGALLFGNRAKAEPESLGAKPLTDRDYDKLEEEFAAHWAQKPAPLPKTGVRRVDKRVSHIDGEWPMSAWVQVEMKDIRRGDVFRMFEGICSNEPVVDDEGMYQWRALEDAIIMDISGAWGVRAEKVR